MSCPGEDSTATTSPTFKVKVFTLLKNSLREFLKRISTTSQGAWPSGKLIFPSQSNTFNLLQPPPVPHDPLLLQPAGIPPFLSCPVEQLPHAISLYIIVCYPQCNRRAKNVYYYYFSSKRVV